MIFDQTEKTVADKLFSELGGESAAWGYLISRAKKHDPRLVFDILRYWTDRKYGKPSQRVEAKVDVRLEGLAERINEARRRVHDVEVAERRLPKEGQP